MFACWPGTAASEAELAAAVRWAIEPQARPCFGDVRTVVGEVAATVSADDLLPSLRMALRVLVQATGADDGEIFLREPDGEHLLLCAWVGEDADALTSRLRFRMNSGYPGIVAATCMPLGTRGELANDPRYLRKAVTDAGICSLVAAPLLCGRGALGSIHLLSRRRDFQLERPMILLEQAAKPISNAVLAGLAELRQAVDVAYADHDFARPAPLQAFLEAISLTAGARQGTLTLIDPLTGCMSCSVSTGGGGLVCGVAEAGHGADCLGGSAARGFIADSRRRRWPEPCRSNLSRRVSSPCCLPLLARGRLFGLIVLDLGRKHRQDAPGLLVPLLTMANQAAIRLHAAQRDLELRERPHAAPGGQVAGPASPGLELRGLELRGLELRGLGPFAVWRLGRPISADSFARSKAVALLKYLALQEGTPVDREALIEHLWPDAAPGQGTNRLHGVLHDLRAVLEPDRTRRQWRFIRNLGEQYYLDISAAIDVDWVRFRFLVTRALGVDRSRADVAIAHLEEAVALYRGDLFADEPFADWCEAEREELRQYQVRALERLALLYGTQGHREEALGCLQRASRAAPFRDDLVLAQMELLSQLSRPNEAVAAYATYQRHLAAELGAHPSRDLQALRHRLINSALSSDYAPSPGDLR